jgi:DNA-binding MarR family transcriptional regulator
MRAVGPMQAHKIFDAMTTVLTALDALFDASVRREEALRTLAVLDERGPLRPAELLELSGVERAGMRKVVQNLAADDFVLRIADSDDMGDWSIAIAPKGTTALRAS